jgi:ribosomal protein L7/L12
MRVIWLSAGAVLLVAVLAVLAVLRRGGGGVDRDLIASHLRSVSSPGAGAPSLTGSAADADAEPFRTPGLDVFSLSDVDGMDASARRQVEELVANGRRMQAITLVRDATGCRLAEAKAVVDRLTSRLGPPTQPRRQVDAVTKVRRPAVRTDPGAAEAGGRRTAQLPPGYAIDPRRPAEPARGGEQTPAQERSGASADEARRLFERVCELAYSGRKVEAIRTLRDHTGMNLHDAKEAVERL